MKKYSRPILSVIFDLLGAVCFVGGGFALVAACMIQGSNGQIFLSGIVSIVVGIVYIGFGQVVDFLARTAYNTGVLVDLARTSPASAPLRQETAKPAQASPKYYYSNTGIQEGPFDEDDIRTLVQGGTITSSSVLIREGETQWRKVSQFPEFR